MLAAPGPPIDDSVRELDLNGYLGEDDMVVTVVVAVLGLSPEPLDMVPPDEGCSASSILWIRLLSSCNSSHTVDCAVVETTDSATSTCDPSREPAFETESNSRREELFSLEGR